MKKYLFIVFSFLGLFSYKSVNAQSFTTQMDTVFATYSGGTLVAPDYISTPSSNDSLRLAWRVIATNWPSDWLPYLSVCDNNNCYYNGTHTLWNSTTNTGGAQVSLYYKGTGTGTYNDFHAALSLSTVTTSGTFWFTIKLANFADTTFTKNITFVITDNTTAVRNVSSYPEDIVLYPNPAHGEVNIVYGAGAGVKNIAIYNLIGKVVSVFKPIDNSSAQLSIENLPTGIYFVRLMDAQGGLVATRKFTKQ